MTRAQNPILKSVVQSLPFLKPPQQKVPIVLVRTHAFQKSLADQRECRLARRPSRETPRRPLSGVTRSLAADIIHFSTARVRVPPAHCASHDTRSCGGAFAKREKVTLSSSHIHTAAASNLLNKALAS